MRILKRSFKKDSEGLVALMPTDEEDLWHLYNLIQEGDCIRMRTFRKVTKTNSTGLKDV
jgi:protein pelota